MTFNDDPRFPEEAFSPGAIASVLGESPCSEAALAMFAAGGKLLRPRLAWTVWRALSGSEDPSAVRAMLLAVECFHRASLVHDDIQDASPERYGEPALHVRIGVNAAIAVGDWLVAKGYSLLAECGTPGAVRAAAARHAQMCSGQALEVMRPGESGVPGFDEAREIAFLKTGAGFALPAELGALAAGFPPLAPQLAEFGFECGTAYQMADDAADLDFPAGTDAEALKAAAAERIGKALATAAAFESIPLRNALSAFAASLPPAQWRS